MPRDVPPPQLIPRPSDDRIVAALRERGYLEPTAERRLRGALARTGTGIVEVVLELGLVPERALYEALSELTALPLATAADLRPDLAGDYGLDPAFLLRVGIVPTTLGEKTTFAAGDLAAGETLRAVAHKIGQPIAAALAEPSAIRAALDALDEPAEKPSATEADVDRLAALANDGPIVQLVSDIVGRAVTAGASDVHIEAEESALRVRYRVDGELSTVRRVADADRAAVVSRLKVMAGLNISERRRPQDGRIRIIVAGREVDLRLSTLPTQFGESIVLRILDRSRIALDFEALGFDAPTRDKLEAVTRLEHGLFLISGPTGSGKTTTLYAMLSRIDVERRKVVTVEDPIEYALPGITQTPVDGHVGLGFAQALRAILRQDPDVVMVGEIRDEETAEIAVRAALIGRLVLSTIHTSTPAAAVERLADLGVARYLVDATLRGVMGQRLARKESGGRVVVPELLEKTNYGQLALLPESSYLAR